MKKWFAHAGWLALGLVLTALIGLMTWEPFAAGRGAAPDSGRIYSAEIVRSEFGVPHIYGESDADVAYGVAIAHSQDDFFTLQDVIANGAELNHTAKFGLSALMLAALSGHRKVAESLAKAGADRSITGTGAPGFAGKTAADLAEDRGDKAAAALLRKG